MLTMVTDKVRAMVWDVLSSERGDGVKPIKLLRETLGTANDLLGRPFAPANELVERRGTAAAEPIANAAPAPRQQGEVAPVAVYFDGKDRRTLKKMEELLTGREIPYQVLDVSNDEATYSWVVTAAKQSEFPLCFIAGASVGGLHELTNLDVNGELQRRVFGGN